MVKEEDTCQQCPLGYVPSANKDQCLLMDAEPLDWESAWVFFPVLFSSVGKVFKQGFL